MWIARRGARGGGWRRRVTAPAPSRDRVVGAASRARGELVRTATRDIRRQIPRDWREWGGVARSLVDGVEAPECGSQFRSGGAPWHLAHVQLLAAVHSTTQRIFRSRVWC